MASKKKIGSEVETPVISHEEVESVETKAVKEKAKVKKEFKDSDYILCRSVWSGGLNVTCKSGATYEFKQYGADCDIEYRDLVYLIRKNSEHIYAPRFVILDEDFLEDFPQVKRVYSTMYSPTELHTILELPVSQMTYRML